MAGGRWRRSGEGDHTKVAPTSRSTAATRWAPLMENPAQFLVGSCRRPGGATSSRPLEGRFLAALSDQFPMTVGAPLVGALRGRIVPRLSRCSTSPCPGARKDAGPSRRLKDAAPDAGPSRRRGRRRSRRRSGRRSQAGTRKSPLHPRLSGSGQAMAGGRWRRSGGGRPQGSPLRVVRQRQRGGRR